MGDSQNEEQVEEHEVLLSIYEGDPKFKATSTTCFQYIVSAVLLIIISN